MFNPAEYTEKLIRWLKEKVSASNREGLVFGLSGGIDSAVVAALAVRAFPENCLGLMLPCGSDPVDREDALLVARKTGLAVQEVDLGPVFAAFLDVVKGEADEPGSLNTANIKPRLRMITLYYYAAQKRYLVVGTSNASEMVTGYFTKYGDSGTDIMPLANLVKGEVFQLAEYLGLPSRVLEKPPSGGLWLGQTDEEEMAITYEAIDAYLQGRPLKDEDRQHIARMEERSKHKRSMPPVPEF